ncbi:hypothetical protein ACFL5V_02955 [Fibrobacterota bacterium]
MMTSLNRKSEEPGQPLMPIYVITCLIALLAQTCLAGYGSVEFNPKDYPRNLFEIHEQTYPHGDVTIRITHVRRKDPSSAGGNSFYLCRAWLSIEKQGVTVKEFNYPDIAPVEGEYGLFVPQQQPSKEFFLVVKVGDYDGLLKLIDRQGNVTNLPGGYYFLAGDSILFSEYHSDLPGLAAFDLRHRQLLFKRFHIPHILQWYKAGGTYFYTEPIQPLRKAGSSTRKPGVIHVYDFDSNKLKQKTHVSEWQAHPQKINYDFDPWNYGNCGCKNN